MVRHARCRWEPLVALAIDFCTVAAGLGLQSASTLGHARGGGGQLVPDQDQGRLLDQAEAELLDPNLRRLIVSVAGSLAEVVDKDEEDVDPVMRHLLRSAFTGLRKGAKGAKNIRHVTNARGGVSGDAERLAATVDLQLLDEKKYGTARCMDGTMGGFYYKQATSEAAKNNWLVHLEGGGECDTQVRCNVIALTALGSSGWFPAKHNFQGAPDVRVMTDARVRSRAVNETHVGLFGRGREVIGAMPTLQVSRRDMNPNYYDWNMVFVPYCSQDLWVGQRTDNTAETFGLYFSGFHIMNAIISTLDEKYKMNEATNIIVSGDSAGGYGAFHHVDRIAAGHPKAKTVGNPIGGMWTYVHPYQGDDTAGETFFSDFREPNWPRMKALWNAYSLESCPHGEAHCMVGCSKEPWPWTFTKSPLFITESNTDSVLSTMHNWLPMPPRELLGAGQHNPMMYSDSAKAWLEAWGKNMTECLSTGAKLMQEKSGGEKKPPRIGIFSPSCFTHTEFAADLRIEGTSFLEAFDDFFHGRESSVGHVHLETGFMQNEHCRKKFCFMT